MSKHKRTEVDSIVHTPNSPATGHPGIAMPQQYAGGIKQGFGNLQQIHSIPSQQGAPSSQNWYQPQIPYSATYQSGKKVLGTYSGPSTLHYEEADPSTILLAPPPEV
jgi:hypothetical protein